MIDASSAPLVAHGIELALGDSANKAIAQLAAGLSIQREGELQLSDDDGGRLAVAQSDEIAPANLALHLEAEPFEEALDGKVEACFRDCGSLPGSR